MPSPPIIQINNLSKSYIISHEGQERYTALRDVMAQKVKKIFSFSNNTGRSKLPSSKEEFWALKDIDFQIERGERVGIIGRNGAGKSTLLKIISRITEPTTGTVKIKGRVASLLEIGTGFHPELTGRENIFLNGAILGMTRTEIKRHFDAIVDFSEIEKFLDTPVKRYSSGMYVRLAFAVAAHMEPDILVVDEVLAVGDAQFQKKCLGKMEDVRKNEGRTILFVSHHMGALKNLCNSSIYLKKGELIAKTSIDEGIRLYQDTMGTVEQDKRGFERKDIIPGKQVQIRTIECIEQPDSSGFRFCLNIGIFATQNTRIVVNMFLKDSSGFNIACGIFDNNGDLVKINEGENLVSINTDFLDLAQGSYKLDVELVIPGFERLDKIEEAISFDISNEQVSKNIFKIDQSWGYGSFEIKFFK